MPVKRLSFDQKDDIYDIIDGDWSDYDDVINRLNHAFAKIYGYNKGRRPSKGRMIRDLSTGFGSFSGGKRKRKLSKWQQFVKKNAKFPRFKYKSGKKKGMINLKALGVAYRKKKK